MDTILELVSNAPSLQVHLILFGLILASGLCLFNEDVVVIAGGLLVQQGLLDPIPTLLTCLAAVLLADALLFGLGRRLGPGAFERPLVRRLIPPGKVDAARGLAARHGAKMILASRFLIGFRAPLYFTWGTLGVSVRRFLIIDALAALAEVGALFSLALYAGAGVGALTRALAGTGQVIGVVLALAVAAGLSVWLVRRGRACAQPAGRSY